MSKFCSKCGSQLEEGAVVCPGCGAEITPAPQGEPVPAPQAEETPAVQAEEVAVPQAEVAPQGEYVPVPQAETDWTTNLPPVVKDVIGKVKSDPKLLVLAAVAVVAVIVILVLVISLFGGKGYTKPIDTLIDVSFNGDYDSIKDLAPEAYWQYMEDEYDTDIDEAIEEAEDNYDDQMDYLEEEYGTGIKVTYDVLDKKELSDNKLGKIAEALSDSYDMDAGSVEKAYELEVEMEVSGSDDDDSTETELTVVRIDGDWYLISYYDYGDEYYASFMLGM